MNVTSVGDLAQNLMLRSRGVLLKTSISTLAHELSTGQVADVTKRLAGDFAYLTDIDLNLARLNGFSVSASEADMFASVAQQSLDNLQNLTTGLGVDILSTIPSQILTVRQTFSARAQGDLETAITTLNARVAGRSLFAGTETDVMPLEDADTLIAALGSEVAGMTDAASIIAAATAWFADPAGFRATMYRGADDTLAPVRVSAGQEVSLDIMADDPTFGLALMNMALSVLATHPGLGLDDETQNALLFGAAEGLMTSQQGLAGLRAELGFTQSRIEAASARNEAERTSLQVARSSLLEADPYQTASRLEEAQFQLESLYSVTVRNARLSLLSYLR